MVILTAAWLWHSLEWAVKSCCGFFPLSLYEEGIFILKMPLWFPSLRNIKTLLFINHSLLCSSWDDSTLTSNTGFAHRIDFMKTDLLFCRWTAKALESSYCAQVVLKGLCIISAITGTLKLTWNSRMSLASDNNAKCRFRRIAVFSWAYLMEKS